ncbi:MAG: bioA [Gammaproteobacteria bacterium]|jgi:adenosylmethionine-8-amino-7-oxononanoate aminotransferase|nr:bioA [Gammaproteobacteria bacterium]
MDTDTLLQLDQNLNWHPCAQMKDYETFKPLVIKSAYGSYIELTNGKKIIDAISSWWCKSLGHNHPQLKEALVKQMEKFEHVLFAHTTHDIIVQLAQKLTALSPNLNKVFYAGDGSSAVEIALKMSVHARALQNQKNRQQFIALKNGYHGETVGALSVSDLGLYKQPYTSILFSPIFIEAAYVDNLDDPLWKDASAHWLKTEKILEPYADTTTAIIIEPIVQGAAGMKIYSADFLSRLASWAKHHGIHIIADEIMTGIGRTGKMLACEYAHMEADFVCLSKGLTSGWLPFSVVLTSNAIYNLFYDDYDRGKAFLHSHTYSGNALGASLALATLKIIEADTLCARACELQTMLYAHMQEIADKTQLLHKVRAIGAIVAADFVWGHNEKLNQLLAQRAAEMGALIRPIANMLYWLPPLNIPLQTLVNLKNITLQALQQMRSHISLE